MRRLQYQGIPYKEQLKKKQKTVENLLGKFGRVQPIVGMEEPLYYRNKVHAVFDRDKKGKVISGIYEAKFSSCSTSGEMLHRRRKKPGNYPYHQRTGKIF